MNKTLTNNIKNSDAFKAAIEIIEVLQNNGFTSVFAGGAVRDMLLNKDPHDWDIATSAAPNRVETLFPNTIPIGKQFGVIIVVINNIMTEVATFREDSDSSDGRRPHTVEFSSMKKDAMRRDLTMNALFFDPISEEIFDFVHGERDLRNEVVKFVGSPEKRIEEDKLRMVRAIRFTSRMGFKLDEASWVAIKNNSWKIGSVSQERKHDEMNKILLADKPSIGIEMLKASGLLRGILPEVEDLWSCEQSPKWHMEGAEFDKDGKLIKNGNVGIHTMMTLDAVRKETDNLILLWAALLHDIGKPATSTIENGNIKAHGHDKKGADITRDILNRLRFSKNDIDDIVWIVENHMRIKHAKEMKKAKLRRLVADERLDGLVLVSKADSASAIKNYLESEFDDQLGWVEKVESFVATLEDQIELPVPLISGKNLIELGFKPGPKFKEILNHISELQLGDEIVTFDEAMKIAKSFI